MLSKTQMFQSFFSSFILFYTMIFLQITVNGLAHCKVVAAFNSPCFFLLYPRKKVMTFFFLDKQNKPVKGKQETTRVCKPKRARNYTNHAHKALDSTREKVIKEPDPTVAISGPQHQSTSLRVIPLSSTFCRRDFHEVMLGKCQFHQ